MPEAPTAGAGSPPAVRAEHGLVLIEIDDFVTYESMFGEAVARSILHGVEARILPGLPESCAYWSPGRGKLALSLPDRGEDDLRDLALGLQRLIARHTVDCAAGQFYLTASVGCAVAATADLPMLGPTAERALAEARRAGRSRCRILVAEAEDETGVELTRRAVADIEAGRLLVAYQTVKRIDQDEDAAPAFLECLARLSNEGAATIEAARFLPGIVAAGRGPALDRLVLSRAFDAMTAMRAHRVSVNVLGQTMADPDWLDLLSARTAVDLELGERLIVEIAEADILADPARAGAFLAGVRGSGAALAIDRFGDGALGTAALRDLGLDIVKLSPELCHGIADAPARQAVLRERVAAASACDLMIVATGLEREADMHWLAAAGVGYAQGHLLSAPEAIPVPLSGTTAAAPRRDRLTSSGRPRSVSRAASAFP